MPLLDKNFSFFKKEPNAGKEQAFKVISFLAAVSFLCAIAGIYIGFIKTPKIQTVYYLAKTEHDFQKDSLINPQPPSRKKTDWSKQQEIEDIHLIQQLEKEQSEFEHTAEAFREIVQNTTEASDTAAHPVLPENKDLQKLQQEKDRIDQKKLAEIEALHQEQLSIEKQKLPETAKPSEKTDTSETPEKKPVEKLKKENKNDSKNVVAVTEPAQRLAPISDQKNELPLPNLIQTDLMASLPDFSLIKKSNTPNAIPLHIIDPLPELQTDSRYGKLPVESKGRTPFSAYSKPVELPPTGPFVALLFSGLGKRDNVTQAAITALPETASLSFSPYAEKLRTYIADARKTGHETLLDLPMQQGIFPETDPGPLGLVSGLPEQENRKRFHKVLGQNVAFIGLTAAANENFSYSGSQMKPFFDEISQRGMIYVDGTDNPRMPLFKNALRPDIHIASEFHRAAIRARLEQARKIALKKGSAFVRIEAVPIALLTTVEWIKSFAPTEQQPVPEISFVPLSYYVSAKKEKK